MLRAMAVIAVLSISVGCGETSTSDNDVVARVGSSELTVTRLAEIAASSSELPIRQEIIEALAMRWVEYSLLGLRTAAGNRLADSMTIVAATWPDVRAAVIDSFRSVRLNGQVEVTPAQVDSVFQSRDARYLRQILKRAAPATPPAQRDSLRAVISAMRDLLETGGSWEAVNIQNDDSRARAANGSMGLVSRGQTVPAFEKAAFALAPGQLSGVVETEFGFHLVYRPTLDEIRDELGLVLRDRFALPLDSVYEEELAARKNVELVDGAPAAVRYAAVYPSRVKGSDRVLATYRGGQFTIDDLVIQLQFLPQDFSQRAYSAPDDELTGLLRSFVLRDLKWQEAESAGVTLSKQRYDQIASAYTTYLNRILTITGLDPDTLARVAESHMGRRAAAATQVIRLLEAAVLDPRYAVPLPVGLSDHLLDNGDWEIYRSGIDMAVLEAAISRSAGRGEPGRSGEG